MTILAIDSSGMAASVAVIEDNCIKGEYSVNYKKTHSQTLLPMIDRLISFLDMDINDFDAIAVSAGPGSFTGLRIGAATAKGLGLAINKPLIKISTLEALAYNVSISDRLICPIMDARRNQVYTALYKKTNNELNTVIEPMAVDIQELIDRLNNMNESIIFVGDGVNTFSDIINNNMNADFVFAPINLRQQRAGALAELGMLYYNKGITVIAAEFEPEYLRVSQAERERNEKLNK